MGAGVGGVDEVVGKEEEEEDRGDGACHAVIELEAQLLASLNHTLPRLLPHAASRPFGLKNK